MCSPIICDPSKFTKVAIGDCNVLLVPTGNIFNLLDIHCFETAFFYFIFFYYSEYWKLQTKTFGTQGVN